MTARELKAIRLARGMTQAQMASKIGVERPTYTHWESGRTPVPEYASRLAKDPLSINPRLTLDEAVAAQRSAQKAGMSLDEWIADLIKGASITPPVVLAEPSADEALGPFPQEPVNYAKVAKSKAKQARKP